ncbi:hypothetical protein G9F73_012440 [Clostridium estertheticum]|uniref:hypothetical protein n=1 Tax=Clostridium estertheticum TaxID=238834 RepID=UPI0013EED2A0|nr:hypothetical protein [Clostridium estertheticum]MBZ9608617.1 hypothetical protein [Clostridium estertheticum]
MINLNDIITYTFSGIAIIIAAITWKKTDKNTKKIAEKTLNTKFFEEIYFEYIIIKLPYALSKIQHDEGRLFENCETAEEIVFTILERSQFYKYFDEKFYNSLKENLIKLDEKLVRMSEHSMNSYILDGYKQEIASLTNKFYISLKTYYSKI